MSAYYITAGYHFLALENLDHLATLVKETAKTYEITGIFILGPEGINCTCAAVDLEKQNLWKKFLTNEFAQEMDFKDSVSEKPPFRRFSLKIRPEICTTKGTHLLSDHEMNNHVEPKEWNRILKEEKDWVMIDTRNWYEYEIGTFQGAINPQTDKFSDFFSQVEDLTIPKDKKILIFCTGGIRCHKGIKELQQKGYEKVFQLQGGILKYLEEYPQDQFQGECFVFDHRVAVDQNLHPTKTFGLCPHCGNPAKIKHTCVRCDSHAFICDECTGISDRQATCSKNCSYHFRLHPERKVRRGKVLRVTPPSLTPPSLTPGVPLPPHRT